MFIVGKSDVGTWTEKKQADGYLTLSKFAISGAEPWEKHPG